MTEVVTCNDQAEWDSEIIERGGHPLQLWGWGEVKQLHGWRAERIFIKEGDNTQGMAQLLIRRLPGVFKALVYVPRGPVCDIADREVVLEVMADYVRRVHPATVLTIEPDWEGVMLPEEWRLSPNTILVPRTLILDLTQTEEKLLELMAKKRGSIYANRRRMSRFVR